MSIVSLICKVKRSPYKVFLLVLLGMLTAFGPFVTDMYLPGLPSMVPFFNTTVAKVQLGLTTSMIGMAVGQLIFGPLSDRFGRRPPLIGAMLLFIVSTIACIYAPSIEIFIVLRLFQGIAGAGGIVISRSVATDLYAGKELVKIMALIGAINGIAPIVSPVFGGLMINHTSWRGIFVLLLILGAILFAACIYFRETHPSVKRLEKNFAQSYLSFKPVLQNRNYRLYVFNQIFALSILFTNISSSPFIIQEHYGFTPLVFGLWFGVNAFAVGAGTLLSLKFKTPENSILWGSAGILLFSTLELFVLITNGSFFEYETLVFIMLLMVGITLPSSTSLSMESEREHSGSASAILGAGGFLMAGIVTALVGIGNLMTTTGIVFLTGAFLSLFCAIRIKKISSSLA